MSPTTQGEHMPCSLARRVQQRLEDFYDLQNLPEVDDFASEAQQGEREVLLVRQGATDTVEIAVKLPAEGLRPPAGQLSLDTLCQIVEGVSHFVYLAHRIRSERPTTQLELELQAEVDKFVVLAFASMRRRDQAAGRAIVGKLYESVTFVHEVDSEEGERYRIANDLAARFCVRLHEKSKTTGELIQIRNALLAFYRFGQEDKIRLARAALRSKATVVSVRGVSALAGEAHLKQVVRTTRPHSIRTLVSRCLHAPTP